MSGRKRTVIASLILLFSLIFYKNYRESERIDSVHRVVTALPRVAGSTAVEKVGRLVPPVSTATDSERVLTAEIKALKQKLVVSEKQRSVVLFTRKNDERSTVCFEIKRLGPIEVTNFDEAIRFIENKVLENGSESDALKRQLSELRDFVHWNVSPEIGTEYSTRVVQFDFGVLYGNEDVLTTTQTEMERVETLESVEGGDNRVAYVGNSTMLEIPRPVAVSRYSHLFQISDPD